MNERIRQLALLTDAWCDENYAGHQFYRLKWEEHFAKLIVRECAGVCEDYRGTKWGKAAECIGDSIREHFGVEL